MEMYKMQRVCASLSQGLRELQNNSNKIDKVMDALRDVRNCIYESEGGPDEKTPANLVRPVLFLIIGKYIPNLPENIVVEALDCLQLCMENDQSNNEIVIVDLTTKVLLLISKPEDASRRIGSENLKISALKVIFKVLSKTSDPVWDKILVGGKQTAFFGHLVYVLLNYLEEKCMQLKLLALDCLAIFPCKAAECEEKINILSKVLPGVVIKIAQCAISSPVLHHSIIISCLQVWKDFVCTCSRKKVEPDEKADLETKLGSVWDKIVESFKTHPHLQVRQTLLKCTISMTNTIKMEYNPAGIRDHSFYLMTSYINDPMISLAKIARTELNIINEDSQLNDQLYAWAENKLYSQFIRLPIFARQGAQEKLDEILINIQGLVDVLGEEGIKRICLCCTQLDSIINAMSQCVIVDHKRIPITQTENWEDWPEAPLKFDSKEFIKTIKLFGYNCDFQTVVYHLSEKIVMSSSSTCMQNIFVLEAILSSEKRECVDCTLLDRVLNIVIDLLSKLNFDDIQSDSIVVDLDRPPTNNSMIAHLCLKIVVHCCKFRTEFKNELLKVLFSVLKCASCGQVFVRHSAKICLAFIARLSGYQTSNQLLLENCDFIVFSVTNQMRRFTANSHCANVACYLIENMAWSENLALSHIKALVNETTMAIDNFHQERCIGSLKILLSFLSAVPKWDMQIEGGSKDDVIPELEMDEEEAKKVPPACVLLSHEVLQRTKQLISSPHLPLRLITLDICRMALLSCRYWDDLLLPMIHQNWSVLMCRFDDSQMDVRIKVVKVVRTMAEISTTFVRRKIEEDFVPKMLNFLKSSCVDSRNRKSVFKQTGIYKLQMSILLNIAQIFKHSKITHSKVIKELYEVCKVYVDDDKQVVQLRNAAKSLCDDVSLNENIT